MIIQQPVVPLVKENPRNRRPSRVVRRRLSRTRLREPSAVRSMDGMGGMDGDGGFLFFDANPRALPNAIGWIPKHCGFAAFKKRGDRHPCHPCHPSDITGRRKAEGQDDDVWRRQRDIRFSASSSPAPCCLWSQPQHRLPLDASFPGAILHLNHCNRRRSLAKKPCDRGSEAPGVEVGLPPDLPL